MKIWLRTESTVVSPEELASWLPAFQVFAYQVASAWQITRPSLAIGKPSSGWQIVVLDDSDQAGALGYHDDPGFPRALIFAKDDLRYGDSITVTLTHELAEMMADPDIVRAMQTSDTRLYALELGDPVEADHLGYSIYGVRVSDFVLPDWFLPGRPGPYDHGKRCSTSLQVLSGGYAQYFENGSWNQVNEYGQVLVGTAERANRFRPRS